MSEDRPLPPSEPTGRAGTRNGFLRSLPADALETMLAHAEWTVLDTKQVLQTADEVPEFAYFPDGGIISFTLSQPSGSDAEFGIIGREGFSCFTGLLLAQRSPVTARVQIGGVPAHRMRAATFRDLILRFPSVRFAVLGVLFAFMGQMATTAVSNARHPLNARLARWLLMCHDRLDDDEVALTQEFMAMMLGARRPSVSSALGALEAAGGIRNRRGAVGITDRRRLIDIAGEAYHPASAPARHD